MKFQHVKWDCGCEHWSSDGGRHDRLCPGAVIYATGFSRYDDGTCQRLKKVEPTVMEAADR